MGSYADRNFLPTPFESSMAEHPEAVQRFMRMTADTRRRVTNQLSQIRSQEEMDRFVRRIAGGKENLWI